MTDTHLFLFGGGPPFTKNLGERFVTIAGKEHAKIVVLFLERLGWQDYMAFYTEVLRDNDVSDFFFLSLSSNPSKEQLEQLERCTGIIIGGGETELYRDYIVDTQIGAIIQDKFSRGVPVAGFSAGALVSPEHCVISDKDNTKNQQLFLKGLGLIKDCVISAHFSTWDEEENLTYAVSKLNVSKGYGIEEDSGLYFKNMWLVESEGDEPYKV
ncbi:Type 1 glutamine amidotransferase-like domain-containing protein [Ferdinandcohnia sp. Marseille-Q9671]